MSTAIYISRNFVEFGPFKPAELINFHSRGILGELDHVREDGHDDWVFISEWVAKSTPKAPAKIKAAAPAPVSAPAPAAKKAAAKKAPAKKAAAKKASK